MSEITFDEHGRPEPVPDGDELATLTEFLDFLRATVAWKSADLTAAQLDQALPPSSMTLGGMLKHLAYVEDNWFGRVLLGRTPHPPWDTVDWSADRDWDWRSAADDDPEVLRAMWQDAVDRSRAATERVAADGGLDTPAVRDPWGNGVRPHLRWILVHLIEEYGRHAGHADLIRQAIDGQVGE